MIRKMIHKILDNWQSGDYESLKKSIDNVEYVSFDIFDTLLKRDVPTPVDVFSIVENNFSISNYKKLRIAAEKRARSASSRGEVTLKEIMDNIPLDEKSYCMESEILSEIELATPNQDIVDIYDYCVKNKKVILISDMYLSREILLKLLQKIGVTGYEKLYISNELNKTKANGELFNYVLQDNSIVGKKILHIGNSFKADYAKARMCGLKSFKLATQNVRTRKNYKVANGETDKRNYLLAFINNHTHKEYSNYEKFGYECFGPLLYGFIKWLYYDMKHNGIEQVFFMARDGYVMRQVYHELGYQKDIPDFYFEASRRSLRIPAYNRTMGFEDVLRELTVPNKTNLVQIFDSLGLEADKYDKEIAEVGLDKTEHLKRDLLASNEKFKKLFNVIYEDVMNNAATEADLLDQYLAQYDFSKKTAIVDIGWGGSMQKYLIGTLNRLHIKNDVIGYYVGLTAKAHENLGCNNYIAKGYAFDVLNKVDNFDMERPFVGLFETLFLEQNGSVKRYVNANGKIIAERYPYEYCEDGKFSKEAVAVKAIQKAALDFAKEYKETMCSDFVGNDSSIYFSNLYELGINPTRDDVKLFGEFVFFNNGSKVYLANPKSVVHYIFHSKDLIRDLFDSQWKIGFLKLLLKVNLPYLKLFNLLRKASN